jgi:uncharacterized membrane protein YesL
MPRAFRVFWSAIRDFFDEFLFLSACNLIWVALCVPLLGFAFFVVTDAPVLASAAALLAVLPMGPASVGLAAVAHRISDGRTASFGVFFEAMRRYARPAWIITGIWMVGMLIILFNLTFYNQVDNLFGAVFYGIWLYILIVWLALQIYLFPLLMLQEKPSLRLLVRNGAVLCLGRPVFTLTTLVLMIAIMALSLIVVVPLVLVTIALFAVWGMWATKSLIEADRLKAEAASPAPVVEEKGRRGQVRPK